MRSALKSVAAPLLAVVLGASPAFARQALVVDAVSLPPAFTDQAALEETQRADVQRMLDREGVQRMAAQMGLDLAEARAAVGMVSGSQLADLARHANAADAALAEGETPVANSLTALPLVIIVVILLAH